MDFEGAGCEKVVAAFAGCSRCLCYCSAIMPATTGGRHSNEQLVVLIPAAFLSQCSRRIISNWVDPFSGTDRERSSTSARGAELLPKARVPILLSGDSLPDSSCRPGLCHCVSTVLCRSLEPRLRGFVLSALDRQLWRLSSRACMSNPQFLTQALP